MYHRSTFALFLKMAPLPRLSKKMNSCMICDSNLNCKRYKYTTFVLNFNCPSDIVSQLCKKILKFKNGH
jgi:hypothetical protein